MAFVENGGARIYWDVEGDGAPVLLIMGLGCTAHLWFRIRPVLAQQYRTIAFDNRGVGRSDMPPGPYSLDTMSSDAAAVLDAAGVQSANVFGVSMGGMIAQEFALNYPTRVRSLILGCTTFGGSNAVVAEKDARDLIMGRSNLAGEEACQASVPFIYDPSTPRERVEEDMVVRRRAGFAQPRGYMAQLQGIVAWQCCDRLSQIHVPTLIIHGESDRLIPPQNSDLIAARITGSQLLKIPHASHMFFTDQPEIAQRAISDFLAAHNAPERRNEYQTAS